MSTAGSPSSSSHPPVPHTLEGRESDLGPPEPGQDLSFDAKVAAEILRLKTAKAAHGETSSLGVGERGEGRTDVSLHNVVPSRARFESDVERAMRELELDITAQKSPADVPGATAFSPVGYSSRRLLPQEPRRAGRAESVGTLLGGSVSSSSKPPPPGARQQQEHQEETGILSQMDIHRGTPRWGKGKSGGLRDMWGEGGSEGHAFTGSEAVYQRRRKGVGGLAEMWQGDQQPEVFQNALGSDRGGGIRNGTGSYSRRQGPGLKGMWSGDNADISPAQPQRQRPGLRGLWAGSDEMITEDAARSDAKAAYLRALDHDAQQRRTVMLSDDGDQQHQQTQQESLRTRMMGSPPSAPCHGNGLFGADVTVGGGGTSLAGIGAVPGMGLRSSSVGEGTSRQIRGTNEEERQRLEDKAKKAAYAEELRRQIAEKEVRKAAEKGDLGANGQRHASTGGRSYNGGVDGPGKFAASSFGGQRLPDHDAFSGGSRDAGSNGHVPFEHAPKDAYRQPPSPKMDRGRQQESQAHPFLSAPNGTASGNVTPLLSFSSPSERRVANDGPRRVTAARRRLVEDVYGGGGMGAALGGSGHRRASIGGTANTSALVTGGSDLVQGMNHLEIGTDSAANGASSGYLRAGAGVQSLHSDFDSGDRWQRRAAALEQQSALKEQIASKARAKKEEEDRRRREDEEEFRYILYHICFISRTLRRNCA